MKDYSELSFSKPKRALFKFKRFFTKKLPMSFKNFFSKIPSTLKKIGMKIANPFKSIKDALVYGTWQTKLSFIIMGSGLLFKKRIAKGILYFVFLFIWMEISI